MLSVKPDPGNWQPSLPGVRPFHGAHFAIQRVNAGNYIAHGHTKQITSVGDWRIDRQPGPPGLANIQIQRNGAPRPSTIACVLVPTELADHLTETGSDGPLESRPRFLELTNRINAALNLSVSSRRHSGGQWQILVYRIDGTFSS